MSPGALPVLDGAEQEVVAYLTVRDALPGDGDTRELLGALVTSRYDAGRENLAVDSAS